MMDGLPTMPDDTGASPLWGVFTQMRGVLLASGTKRIPQQAAGERYAGCYRPFPGEPWPGCGAGIRAPRADETPLSYDEVRHAMKIGIV